MKMFGSSARKSTTARLVLAVVFSCFMMQAHAALGQAQFAVTATLLGTNGGGGSGPPPVSASGFCTKTDATGFGATVTVVCSTGAVVDSFANPWQTAQGGAYRYLYQVRSGDVLLGTIDSYSGIGNETSWRVIDLVGRKYLEMQVGW